MAYIVDRKPYRVLTSFPQPGDVIVLPVPWTYRHDAATGRTEIDAETHWNGDAYIVRCGSTGKPVIGPWIAAKVLNDHYTPGVKCEPSPETDPDLMPFFDRTEIGGDN